MTFSVISSSSKSKTRSTLISHMTVGVVVSNVLGEGDDSPLGQWLGLLLGESESFKDIGGTLLEVAEGDSDNEGTILSAVASTLLKVGELEESRRNERNDAESTRIRRFYTGRCARKNNKLGRNSRAAGDCVVAHI
jgi:hypothetical protein